MQGALLSHSRCQVTAQHLLSHSKATQSSHSLQALGQAVSGHRDILSGSAVCWWPVALLAQPQAQDHMGEAPERAFVIKNKRFKLTLL